MSTSLNLSYLLLCSVKATVIISFMFHANDMSGAGVEVFQATIYCIPADICYNHVADNTAIVACCWILQHPSNIKSNFFLSREQGVAEGEVKTVLMPPSVNWIHGNLQIRLDKYHLGEVQGGSIGYYRRTRALQQQVWACI